MTLKRRHISLILLGLLLLPITLQSPFAHSADSTYVATPPRDAGGNALPGYIGVDSKPSEQLLIFPSFLINLIGKKGAPTSVNACSSVDDSQCAGGYLMLARAELQPCTPSNPTDCFLDLIVRDSNGKSLAKTLLTDVMQPMKQNFVGNQKMWLPTGGNPLIFKIPGAAHAGGDMYLVKPDVYMSKGSDQDRFNLIKFEAGIFPVSARALKSDKPRQSGASTNIKDYGGQIEFAGDGDYTCEDGISDGKNCFVPESFPSGLTFGLNLRLSQSLYGWLHGRFQDPEITINSNPESATGVDLSIIAKPIRVPAISGFIKSDSAPSKILKYFESIPRWGQVFGLINENARSGPLSDLTIAHNHIDPSEETFLELSDWLDVLGDTSSGETSYWLVQTIIGGNGDEVERCTKDAKSLAGVVSTNATSYLPGPPRFDQKARTLDYKVLAPHYAKDKSLFLGTYNLVINGDLARCIYGFTKAPVGATISVVSTEGTSRLASTLVKQDDRFVTFAISGFEFSNPTIKVQFTQNEITPVSTPSPTPTNLATPTPQATATPTPTPIPKISPQAAATAKKTITCKKGSKTIRVIAVNPKCPSGYKRT